MKVSIVTISYNQAEFLEETILSVLDQDYHDIEYIVVDPGSTDGSREIIEKYRDRIDHIILEPDNGPADGLNKGFSVATGDVYAYLNSDDILYPNVVSRFVNAFLNKPKVDVISGHGDKIDSVGIILGRVFSNRFNMKDYIFGACVLVQQSTFFKAKVFHKVGGFNLDNKVGWDGELWFDMALSGARFSRINGFLSGFRMHEGSITVSGRVAHLEKIVKARLAKKIGIEEDEIVNKWAQRFYWMRSRLADPSLIKNKLFGRKV